MVKEEKLKAVEELKRKIEESEVVGLLDMHKLPSKQYQEIQKHIRGDVQIVFTKKSILEHSLEGADKPKMKELKGMLPTQSAILFTKMEPFKFYMTASRLKSPTYAKDGDVADSEIFIGAGPTSLMPGPVISEFAKVGIPAGVEEGKIAIKRDKVVAKRGDTISKDLANVLRKLKIQTTKVGLNIVAVCDKDGTIYLRDVLALAGQGYIDRTLLAHQHAINLSVAAGHPTKENIKLLLAKAYRESQAIASKVKLPEPAAAAPQEEKKGEAQEAGKQEQTERPKSEEVQTQDNKVGGTS